MEVFLHKEDMPKSCTNCRFTFDMDYRLYCLINNCVVYDSNCVPKGQENVQDNRHSTCPLKIINKVE